MTALCLFSSILRSFVPTTSIIPFALRAQKGESLISSNVRQRGSFNEVSPRAGLGGGLLPYPTPTHRHNQVSTEAKEKVVWQQGQNTTGEGVLCLRSKRRWVF